MARMMTLITFEDFVEVSRSGAIAELKVFRDMPKLVAYQNE